MSDYKVTIGLEIHAELKTATKMFCNSKNDPDEKRPNVNICPICMGHPGTLPVINKQAVKNVLKVGLALGSEIADFTEFDRKNYFYPDIPKGYQISQYKFPLVKGGSLNGVKITRVHLEEDTAKSSHDDKNFSLVDYNRAGVPLMELVTEPVIHSAEEASNFAKELQLLLQYLGVSDANMEKGEMRVEANISISADPNILGTKVEVKNLNSFKAVEKAVAYEVERMKEALENGEKIVQETRGWDDSKQRTFSQRLKEESHDYRYFPNPDLPKLKLSEVPEFSAENLRKEMPELPWEKRKRYEEKFGIKKEDIEVYINNLHLAKFFEEAVSDLSADFYKTASNYITSDLIGLIKTTEKSFEDSKLDAKSFSILIKMISEGKLSSRGGKDLLAILFNEGGDPEKLAEEKGLIQKSNEEELKKVIEAIIEKNPKVVADYKAGKEASLQFLIGQGMRETKGSANPAILKKIFIELLSK
jgi:aspartyl-tRNA(Asn)/glutamyl-tRNA(Gln) amidotransferase subunit B